MTGTATAAVRAVLLDIDGTLVDSNYLHVEAWARAFAELDLPVDSWRIHRCIGMDSEKLLGRLISDLVDDLNAERRSEVFARAKELHADYYEELVPRLRPFAGARRFVATLAERGIHVVLATSAPEAELRHLRAVLDVDAHVAAITSGDDVSAAKPHPGIINVAIEKVGADAADSIMIGDSVWDVEAAGNANLACIGLLSGGLSRAELREAGALAVYTDVAELLAELEHSPLAGLWSD